MWQAHAAALKAAGMLDEASGGGGASSTGGVAGGEGGLSEDDKLPFACLLCREPWHAKSNPVVTRCEHYFCEDCALSHAAKTKRCFVCAENTGGIFNACKPLQEKIAREAARLRVCEEVEAGGEQSDEALLKEYEESKVKQRGFTGGWGLV